MKFLDDKLSKFYDRILAEKLPDLTGSVDNFEADQFIGGWARDRNNPDIPLMVVVELRAVPVATSLANLVLADRLPRFRIDVKASISVMDIAEHRVKVIAVAKNGTRAELSRHYPFIQAIMRRLFPPLEVSPSETPQP